MRRYHILVLIIHCFFMSHAQQHPLSKSDSGVILLNLAKYDDLLSREDLRGASGALNNAAFVFWNNNHFARAAELYEKSLKLNQKVANENGIAMIHNNLGMLYSDLGKYQESLEHFTSTLAARRANKEPVGMISALINMSVVLNNLHEYDESIKNLTEALDLAREIYDRAQMRSVYGMLSETYEKMGNVEKSLEYFQLYKSFHEEIQREKVKKINEELIEEKAEKTERENELLKKQLELFQTEAQLQKKDSINQTLYSNLSRKDMEIELLKKDQQVKDLEASAQLSENHKLQNEQKYLRNTLVIIVFSVLTIGSLLIVGVVRSRRYAGELKKRNESIEKQREELEEANQAKDRMFSIISHDLRSPISSLQGLFGLIDDIEMSNQLRRALDSVEGQLTNSAGLLENLLVWSKTQITNKASKRELIGVQELVEETFRLLEPKASEKGISLISAIKDTDMVNTDKAALSITIRNVVQNAVKFTDQGGSISVTFQQQNAESVITIADTGVGMKPEKLAKIFDISANRSSVGTQNEKGSGLGLILCKELIQRAGGRIEVASTLGKGTSFSLIFNEPV